MNTSEIAFTRLVRQQIVSPRFTTPREVVTWMGAVQAQDFAMAKWALGLRLPGGTLEAVDAALDRGEILRTHVLRPTWHLTAASDLRWMLALSAPRLLGGEGARRRELGLTDEVLRAALGVVERELGRGTHLTRDELGAAFTKAGLATDENRASHMLAWAELNGLACSGASKNGKPTYALLDERVPAAAPLTKDEALHRLALRYFTGRGPATLEDFTWWSGLSMGEARKGLESARGELLTETIEGRAYWFADGPAAPRGPAAAAALPAFDEYLIAYADRTAALPTDQFRRAVSANGIFYPILTVAGRVVGRWKRTVKGARVVIAVEYFGDPPEGDVRAAVEQAFIRYGVFLGKEVEFA